jgi:hypothetical protein
VDIRVNAEVVSVHWLRDGTGRQYVTTADGSQQFYDAVINATGYTSALPDGLLSNLPIKLDTRYQACIALHYRDTKSPADPGVKPLSFIVMDGWFPSLMPSVGEPGSRGKYVLTHGAYTILGPLHTPAAASHCLTNLSMTPEIIDGGIRPKIETEMERFWPGFTGRFVYQMVTDTEFRSSVVFERDGVIYIFPGKISNVVEASDEAKERNTCVLQTQQSLAVRV